MTPLARYADPPSCPTCHSQHTLSLSQHTLSVSISLTHSTLSLSLSLSHTALSLCDSLSHTTHTLSGGDSAAATRDHGRDLLCQAPPRVHPGFHPTPYTLHPVHYPLPTAHLTLHTKNYTTRNRKARTLNPNPQAPSPKRLPTDRWCGGGRRLLRTLPLFRLRAPPESESE